MNYKDIDLSILTALQNPCKVPYEIVISIPELTTLGAAEQPDFGELQISYTPDKFIIELKSLKKYFYQFRECLISYERLAEVIYNDLQDVYKPRNLSLSFQFRARGGISSTIKYPVSQ